MNSLNTAMKSLQNPLGSGLRKKDEPMRSKTPMSWDERRQRAKDRIEELKAAVANGEISKKQAMSELKMMGMSDAGTGMPGHWLYGWNN